jgi:hypothetical protein
VDVITPTVDAGVVEADEKRFWTAPGVAGLDFSVLKNTPISEKIPRRASTLCERKCFRPRPESADVRYPHHHAAGAIAMVFDNTTLASLIRRTAQCTGLGIFHNGNGRAFDC